MSDLTSFFSNLAWWVQTIIIIWIVLLIMNKSKRTELAKFIGKMSALPSIYKQTEDFESIPLYFREFFEETAKFFKEILVDPLGKRLEDAIKWVESQLNYSSEGKEQSQKAFGFVLQAVFFFAFIFADIIVVYATLQARGMVQDIPRGFRSYELAVTAGSLLSAVVGAFAISEIFGRSNLSNWDTVKETVWEKVAKWIAFILLISGILAVIGLGLTRFDLINPGDTNNSQIYQALGDFIITVLVFLNSTLAAILIGSDAVIGIRILLFIVVWGVLLLLKLFHLLIITIALGFVWQILDVVNRILLSVGKILLFIIETPVQTILEPIANKPPKPIEKPQNTG